MNPKNAKKNGAKPTPKKKFIKSTKKSVVPVSDEKCENNSKFYVSDDNKIVVEQPDDSAAVIEKTGGLTRKLSKIYAKLSGSRESLNSQKSNNVENMMKVNEKPQLPSPFRFQRSLTLNSIHLGKAFKQRPPLEKLSEERIGEADKTKSPSLSPPPELIVEPRRRHKSEFRQSLPPGTFDEVDFSLQPAESMTMMSSPPPLQRSNSIISLFRRKVSQHSNELKQETMNSRWTTSLQSLQQIDNMVSYEDLSFIDYDKLNQYESKLDEMLARTLNNDTSAVRRRVRKHELVDLSSTTTSDSNLDRQKNVFRQSIDSRKLNFLNDIDSDKMVDWLAVEAQKMELEQSPPSRKVSEARDQRRSDSKTSLERIAESSKRKRKFRSWESLSTEMSKDTIEMVSGQ